MRTLSALFQRPSSLYVFAISASLLLSFWIGFRETVINPDGICYLMSAQMVGTASLNDVIHLCPQSQWPFYSILIYGLAQLSHFSYTVSAYAVDGLFSLISVVAFILIVKELGGTQRVLWLAALTILLSHQFNSVREYIIRDHGFWAGYLVSLLLLLNYFRTPRLITALAWNASLLMATLFRIEGAVFLLILPFLSWFYFRVIFKQRAIYFFSLHALTLCIGIALSVWVLFHPQHLVKLGRLSEVTNHLQHGMSMLAERFDTMRRALSEHVLTQESAGDVGLVLFLVWVSWYVGNLLTTLSWIYGALVIYAWWNKAAALTTRSAFIVWGYLGVNFLVTFPFLIERSFLSKRYLVAEVLVLMVWVPFALNSLLQKTSELRQRILLSIVALFIVISSLGGIIDFGYSKSYIRAAGDWITENVPQKASLYVNDFQLMYYSHHFGNRLFEDLNHYLAAGTIAHGQWKQYDYLALRLGAKEESEMAAVLKEISPSPIRVFSNKRGDRVAIYQVSQEEKIR